MIERLDGGTGRNGVCPIFSKKSDSA